MGQGPIYGRFVGFYVNGFLYIQTFIYKLRKVSYTEFVIVYCACNNNLKCLLLPSMLASPLLFNENDLFTKQNSEYVFWSMSVCVACVKVALSNGQL